MDLLYLPEATEPATMSPFPVPLRPEASLDQLIEGSEDAEPVANVEGAIKEAEKVGQEPRMD